MFWKTTIPLLIILIDSNNYITEVLRMLIFIVVSSLALCYWINRTSKDYLQPQKITWKKYFQSTFRTLAEGFKSK